MGGGNSKKAEVIKATPQSAGSSQFAAPVEKGPSSKPNFGEPSPAMSQGKGQTLQRNESQEMDGSTPNQQAKQQKMQVAQTSIPPAAAVMMQSAPSPAPSPKKVESQADRSQMLAQQKRDMDAKRQRQMEEEKVRKLQLINEQQKAKKAAESAAAAAEATRKKQMNQQKQQETFAQHQDSQGRQESQSNDLNSPQKRGKKRNDDNVDLSVNGAGLNRAESKPAMAVAPVAQVQFKVVQYNPEKEQNIGGNPWANDQPQYKEQGTIDNATPIHFGVMNQNNSKNDQEADRNINMNDLNELLGI